MSKVVMSVSASLDGFAAGPNVGEANPMGEGGEALHAWLFAQVGDPADEAVKRAINSHVGAALIGRRTFDLGLPHWGGSPWDAPGFVVTHGPMADLIGDNGGRFVFGDLASMVGAARTAAGERNVMVLGPGLGQALLAAGELDEIWLQQAPIVLGGGTPLFAATPIDLALEGKPSVGSVTHLRLRVRKA